jgi:hypothetical protein
MASGQGHRAASPRVVSHLRESMRFTRRLRNGSIQKPAFYSGVRSSNHHDESPITAV